MSGGNNNNDNNKSTFELIQLLGLSVCEPWDLNIETRVYINASGVFAFVGIAGIMFNWDNTKAALQDLQEVLVCKKW